MAVRSAIRSIEDYLRGILPSSAVVVSEPDAVPLGLRLTAAVYADGFTAYRRGRVYSVVVRIESPKNMPEPTEAQIELVLGIAELLTDHVTDAGADDMIIYWGGGGIEVDRLELEAGVALSINLPLCTQYPVR